MFSDQCRSYISIFFRTSFFVQKNFLPQEKKIFFFLSQIFINSKDSMSSNKNNPKDTFRNAREIRLDELKYSHAQKGPTKQRPTPRDLSFNIVNQNLYDVSALTICSFSHNRMSSNFMLSVPFSALLDPATSETQICLSLWNLQLVVCLWISTCINDFCDKRWFQLHLGVSLPSAHFRPRPPSRLWTQFHSHHLCWMAVRLVLQSEACHGNAGAFRSQARNPWHTGKEIPRKHKFVSFLVHSQSQDLVVNR